MSIQAIVQVAEQTNLGKIDGIFQIARCVKNLYDEVNIKGNRGKFEKAVRKHLNISKSASFIWMKINKNEQTLMKYKSSLPLNIHCLDAIASMEDEEIKNGIVSGDINNEVFNVKKLRKFQHTLSSYKKRNANHLRLRKIAQEKKVEDLSKQKEVKKEFDKKANNINKEPVYNNEGLTKEIDSLNKKYEDIMNQFYNLNKKYEETKDRIDLIQKLLMKM